MTDTQFVRGADKLQRRIATIRANLHLPLMMEQIGALLERRTLQRFDREVDPDNNPWAPLKESYAKRKIKESDGKKILVRRGDLRAAIRRVRGGLGVFAINTGAGFRIGVADPAQTAKARALNFGTATIKARRFLGIGALDIRAVDSLLRRKALQLENL